jgi:hypothetical protein
VAIQSASEFEAIITQVINRIEKELVALGGSDSLENAHRELTNVKNNARDVKKLKAARAKLDTISDLVSSMLKDEKVLNQMWDLLDYIDYRA